KSAHALFAAQQLVLERVLLPILPPSFEVLPLLRQPALVKTTQTVQGRPHALAFILPGGAGLMLRLLKAAKSYLAIVGVAENLLHLLDRGVDVRLDRGTEAVGEHFQGVTQAFAGDADLVEVFIVVEILARRLVQLLQIGRASCRERV